MMPQTTSTPRKNICFFCGDVTRCGGAEKVAVTIANMLHGEGRYRVFFLSLTEGAGEPFFPLEPGIDRYRLGQKWIRPGPGYLKVIPKLRRFLKERDVDVIIDVDIVLDCLAIPAAKGQKTKVISWEHFNYQFEQSSAYRRLIQKYSVKRSDYIVTLTQADREQYEQHFGRAERIRAIYNPIEDAHFDPGLAKEKWLITVGRLAEEKGLDHLVQVADTVLHKHPDWQWILLGEGERRTFLEEEIHARHLENRLILKGNVRDVGSYLQRARIYVMTSRIEGFGVCLLEAKAYGLPCVAFDVPTGPAELISDGINGFLVPAFELEEMGAKIGRLMEDEALRERFSRIAGLGTERCRGEYILPQWNQVIAEVCGE